MRSSHRRSSAGIFLTFSGSRCAIATGSFLEDLIEQLQAQGYSFVSFPEALSDPAYKTEELYVGPSALSFIDRVAATRGLPFDPGHGELKEAEVERRMKVEAE